VGTGHSDENAKELFAERAAIRGFDGVQSREAAEAFAALDVQEQMFRCEVASVCRMRREKSLEHAQKFLLGVEEKRGREAADRLRAAANDQWGKGNRGNFREWI